MFTATNCPCDSGLSYQECCKPLLDNVATAKTAEQLMRSRYTANVYANVVYLQASWHTSTRPAPLQLDKLLTWTGLEIIQTQQGTTGDQQGWVEFKAHFQRQYRQGRLHERSFFLREQGEWRYVDGVFPS